MSICTVNGLPHELEAGLETWGQLLTTLEQGEGPARQVVAAVRFAGVDQPTFREPEALALTFRRSAPIEVELSTAGELVASARAAVLGCLEAMAESARHTAESFRLHDSVAGAPRAGGVRGDVPTAGEPDRVHPGEGDGGRAARAGAARGRLPGVPRREPGCTHRLRRERGLALGRRCSRRRHCGSSCRNGRGSCGTPATSTRARTDRMWQLRSVHRRRQLLTFLCSVGTVLHSHRLGL